MGKLVFKDLDNIQVPKDSKTLNSGLPEFDVYLRQGCPDLIFLGGRPGSGKTLLAAQAAFSIAQDTNVLFFSLEMTKEQLKGRLARGRTFSAPNLLICDQPGLYAEEIYEAILDQEVAPGLVIVDYAQIVQGEGRSKSEEVGLVVRKLKAAAKQVGCPILLLAQLSREIEKRSTANEFAEPQMSDFADSAEIEKFGDACLMLHHVPKSDGVTRVYCTKNRHGDSQNFDLRLNRKTLKFEEANKVTTYQF